MVRWCKDNIQTKSPVESCKQPLPGISLLFVFTSVTGISIGISIRIGRYRLNIRYIAAPQLIKFHQINRIAETIRAILLQCDANITACIQVYCNSCPSA